MERTRIAKVEDVALLRRGVRIEGTIHLTSHHLIFVHQPKPDKPMPEGTSAARSRPKEIWITYPIIQNCILRLTPQWSSHRSSIRLRCRDFTFYAFQFPDEHKARDVFESIKSWTCKIGRMDKLYAFSYQPQPQEKDINGWSIYDPRQEFKRMGISEKGSDKGWRISNLNANYGFCSTYPSMLVVPSLISDSTLKYAAEYRSKQRLPVLSYLHPINNCSITRCSQPLVGVRMKRSIQDEKLLAAIFSATNARSKGLLSEPDQLPSGAHTPQTTEADSQASTSEISFTNIEAVEDSIIAEGAPTAATTDTEEPRIYGAQRSNLIVDARPTINAYAMQTVGMGSEIMENYPFAEKVYLGIQNIHKMRKSLYKVIEALKDTDVTPMGPNRQLLADSGWISYISCILDGVGIIVRQIGIKHSNVLIHCSDGWDRTSQLSALAQLCLDPYYRTIEGFIVLIEKDFLSFGHMFETRSGYLNSESWFTIENERSVPTNQNAQTNGAGATLEDAFFKAKAFFTKEATKSKDPIIDSEDETNPMDSAPKKSETPVEKHHTRPGETAPIFHQFLDAAYQLLYQNPNQFEFNERFLRRILYHLYSCQYGTFLYNSERERKAQNLAIRTRSVWDYFLSRREQFTNQSYDAFVNDHERGKERLIFPKPKETRWWPEVFGREDSEMNGPIASLSTTSSSLGDQNMESSATSMDSLAGPHTALTGVESAERTISPAAIASASRSATASPARQGNSARMGSGASPFARFENNGSPSQTNKAATSSTTGSTIHNVQDNLSNVTLDDGDAKKGVAVPITITAAEPTIGIQDHPLADS